MTNSTSGRPGRGRPSREVIYKRFATAIDELANYGGLPKPYEAKSLWDHLWHLEAHHSTAIEGNTLVLREVETLLEQGRAVGAKELKDYMEVLGYAEAARWVYQQAVAPDEWSHDGLVTVTEVRRVHALAMAKVWEVAPHPDAHDTEGPGNWRQHEIQGFAGGMKPPTFPLIPSEITAWVDRANHLQEQIADGALTIAAVPEELARLHREFECVHPFIDGNGRSGRLLLNLLLIRLGWPPAIILKEQRRKYLRALERSGSVTQISYGNYVARVATEPLATAGRNGKPVISHPRWPLMVQDGAEQDVPDARFMASVAHLAYPIAFA